MESNGFWWILVDFDGFTWILMEAGWVPWVLGGCNWFLNKLLGILCWDIFFSEAPEKPPEHETNGLQLDPNLTAIWFSKAF